MNAPATAKMTPEYQRYEFLAAEQARKPSSAPVVIFRNKVVVADELALACDLGLLNAKIDELHRNRIVSGLFTNQAINDLDGVEYRDEMFYLCIVQLGWDTARMKAACNVLGAFHQSELPDQYKATKEPT